MQIIFWNGKFTVMISQKIEKTSNIYEIQKEKVKIDRKISKSFNHIKELLVKSPVLCMLTVNDKIRLESDKNKMAAGAAL